MARARAPVIRSVKTPDALAELRSWLEGFDERERTRGEKRFADKQVEEIGGGADHYVTAKVRGDDDELCAVTLFLTRGRWTSQCSCEVRTNCEHAYAAGRAWLDAANETPVTIPVARVSDAPSMPFIVRSAGSFREQWSPILAEKLGRPLTEREGAQLAQLGALFDDLHQHHGKLPPGVVLRHGFDYTPPDGAPFYAPAYDGWWDETNAPADPWALWQFIAYDYELHERPIPEVFAPLTNTSGIRALIGDRLIQHELAAWRRALDAAESSRIPASRHPALSDISGIRARLRPDGSVSIEVRTGSSATWKAPPQKWFGSMQGLRPADFEHLAPAEAALGLTLAAEMQQELNPPSVRRPLPETVVSAVFRTRAARDAIVLPDGSPLSIEIEPLLLEASPRADSAERLELRLVTPEGRDASAAKLITREPSALYWFDEHVWPGPPDLPHKPLPLAALSDVRLMTRLRSAGLRLPESLEKNIRRVPLRPLLRCWLAPVPGVDDSLQFHAQLLARADEGPFEQHYTRSGWEWTTRGKPPNRRPDEPLLEFDLNAAIAAVPSLGKFGLTWHGWEENWARDVTESFADDFIAWRATLPPTLRFEASPGLANLLEPPTRARIDLSATPLATAGPDWFNVTAKLRVEDTTLTQDEIAVLLRARGKWVNLPKRGWKKLEISREEDEATRALDRLGLDVEDVLEDGRASTHRMHALQLAAEADVLEARDAKFAAKLRERVQTLASAPPPPLPSGLLATLRPYQCEGFRFLAHLSSLGLGGVLADDMGLGKTVQTLAWLLWLAEERRAPPAGDADSAAGNPNPAGNPPFRALVVCPKSVIHGWLVESARFSPSLNATAFTPGSFAGALTSSLLVANYTQLRIHAEWFRQQAWDAVVLDEGQFIKNPGSQVAAAARALPSRHRLVLTGTPIENRLLDLWSLFAFVQPGLLGTQASFRRQHAQADSASLARLHRRVRHFLLRRTKAQAAPELPPRTEDDLVVDLEGEQRVLYDAELKRARAQILGVETGHALTQIRFNVLASLLRLRQICCHPALVDPAHRNLPSAKLDALLERLEELAEEGHQVLVFSQFVEMLELIRDRLIAARIGFMMLTGSTENRAELVDEFQRDRSKTVFLLSLKAAGFGLNLTAASYVILYDPWWNPAAEAQAIDRTHRIGQTQPVVAYRLLAENTVEEKIRALQREKAVLASSVVQEDNLANILDLDSLREILS